jgi:hypothetical protein
MEESESIEATARPSKPRRGEPRPWLHLSNDVCLRLLAESCKSFLAASNNLVEMDRGGLKAADAQYIMKQILVKFANDICESFGEQEYRISQRNQWSEDFCNLEMTLLIMC